MSIIAVAATRGVRTDAVSDSPDPPDPPDPPAQTFAQWLASTNGAAGPAHYWEMDDASGTVMAADIGTLAGTYINTADIEYAITDSAGLKWIGLGLGTGAINIVNPVTTAAFTWLFRLQLDAAPTGQMTLATSAFSSTAGQYVIQVDTDGAGGMKPRYGRKDAAGASVIYLGTAPGSLPVGRTFHYIYVSRSNGTQEVWVHDIQAGTVSLVPATLNTGTQPGSWNAPPSHTAFIGSSTTGGSILDGLIKSMATWDVALSSADIQGLALITPALPSVVVGARTLDAGTVEANAQLSNISVLNNVHPATGFTVSAVQSVGNRGTLTASGSTLTYTAGATAGSETTATWRSTKSSINSPTVNFNISVTSTAPPPSNQANCFTIPGSSSVTIGSGSGDIGSALAAAINAAPPGRHILIAPGTYSGGTVTFNRDGTSSNKIVVRPQNGPGTVTIIGARWTFATTSSHIVLYGLYHTGASIDINGAFHRITRNRFRGIDTNCLKPNYLTDSRIDHCDFSGMATTGNQRAVIRFIIDGIEDNFTKRNLIDYNYFHDMAPTDFQLHNIIIIPENDGVQACLNNTDTIIDHCLFLNIDRTGSQQDIDFKSSGTTVRFCTFLGGGNSYLHPRAANNLEYRSNWLENVNGTRPIGCFGADHLIIGNRIVGSGRNMWISPGNTTVITCAPAVGFARSQNCRIIGNHVDGQLDVGRWWAPPEPGPSFDAINNIIEAHIGTIDLTTDASQHSGTVVHATTSEPFVPAVKIPTPTGSPSTDQVGLVAKDPLCPSGPQS